MSTKDRVREELEATLVPGAVRSLRELNLIRDVRVTDGQAVISIASAALNSQMQDWIKSKATESISSIPGVSGVDVSFVEAKPKEVNNISHVVAVMSGKGGVGKSLVTGLLASTIKRNGYDVGVMDALVEMTAKKLGMTAVIDAQGCLLGIFTDGDLRRLLAKSIDINTALVADVMTENCQVIRSDILAAEAMQVMEEKKINALIVVDDESKVVGALNMHDLIHAGIV